MAFEKTSMADFQIYHASNPNFVKPRGNMFMVTTRTSTYDYNFAGTNTASYPTAGVNLFPGGPTAPSHGVYVIPPAKRVVYISGLRFAFNITSKGIHDEPFLDRVSAAASPLELVHNSVAICDSTDIYDITLRSDEAPQEIAAAFSPNDFLYGQHWALDIPGRFDGDVSGSNFGLRTNGGNGFYLGASFAANEITHLHIQFTGWVVDKIEIGDQFYDAIPIF
jgi:hypothetical protein